MRQHPPWLTAKLNALQFHAQDLKARTAAPYARADTLRYNLGELRSKYSQAERLSILTIPLTIPPEAKAEIKAGLETQITALERVIETAVGQGVALRALWADANQI